MAIPISDKSDEYLMEEIAASNQASFRVLVMRYLQPGYGFVQRMLNNANQTEKIIQAVFLKIWQTAPTWEPTMRFKNWFYRILIKECAKLRSHVPKSILDAAVFEDDKTHDVKIELAALSKKQKIAFVLYYYQECTITQIAKILNTSPNIIENLLCYARKKLSIAFDKLLLDEQKSYHGNR